MLDKYVTSMAAIRIISGSIEIIAALVMFRLGRIDKALAVNAMLAFVGPTVLMVTTMIGLAGIADKLSWNKMIWIGCGISCLLIGILKK
ncbi:YqhV family protein [Paenibacillus fonticola]|uniref:YqhV family protein n=1 Tax=Paenibacillus fonticola TaxID=379896 RepID=UPI0003790B4B|nr:YqhV family protein [Paenibacillus fonticola]